MIRMRIEILTVGNQLAASAVNGIYQGIIVAAFVALTLRLCGRTNATTRHAIWFCALLLLVFLLVAHCLIGRVPFSHATSKADVAIIPNPGLDAFPPVVHVARTMAGKTATDSTAAVASLDYRTPDPEEAMERSDSPPLPLTQAVASAAQSNPTGFPSPQLGKPAGNEPGAAASPGEELASNVSGGTTGFRWLAERLANPVSLKPALAFNIPGMASMILLVLWLTIAGFRVLALLWQLGGIRRLKHRSFPPGAGLNELFHKLAAHLHVNRKVALRISPTHRSSFLLGFLHPVILLPLEEHVEPAEIELVLRHELAHVRRCDDWANLIQHLILAVFFFHPAVWWISRQLSLEREIACDDHVLQQSRRPQAYALLLANLAARMQRGLPLLAPGSSNNKTQLKERIDMILNTHRNTSPRLAKTWLAFITTTVALMAAAIICSAPRIVLAQIKTAAAAANAPSADVPSVAPASGIASGAFAPEAPDSNSADAAPQTTPPAATIGAGPRFKSDSSSAQNIPPAIVASPADPLAPTPSLADVAPPIPPTPFLAAIEPPPEPQTPPLPRTVRAPRPGNKDLSLEERLERLEQMVESLANQQNPKGHADFHLKADQDGIIDRKEIAEIKALAKRQAELAQNQMMNPKEIEKIQELAERDAARAAGQVKRETADMEKAVKADPTRQTDRKIKEGSQRQLEALRKQLEILERQKEKLDRQIEHLEQDQGKLDEQRDEEQAGSDSRRDESKEEQATPPPAAR
jgi:beta-lactamase regulating signal transducer with metallopeptidase domain